MGEKMSKLIASKKPVGLACGVALLAAGLVIFGSDGAAANCVTGQLERIGDQCRLTLENQCRSRQICFVGVPTYASNGQLYPNGYTLRLAPGQERWHAATGAACGRASWDCRAD